MKLNTKVFPMITAGKDAKVIQHYVPYMRRPLITEQICNDTIKHTSKNLANGRTLETFENNGQIYKVLKDLQGNPMVVRQLKNGKRRTFRFFANEVYSNLKSKFNELTDGFINLK